MLEHSVGHDQRRTDAYNKLMRDISSLNLAVDIMSPLIWNSTFMWKYLIIPCSPLSFEILDCSQDRWSEDWVELRSRFHHWGK